MASVEEEIKKKKGGGKRHPFLFFCSSDVPDEAGNPKVVVLMIREAGNLKLNMVLGVSIERPYPHSSAPMQYTSTTDRQSLRFRLSH